MEVSKKRSRDKGLEFNIEPSDIVIPNFCPYLGLEISHEIGTGKRRPGSPSLDRIDSSKGYTKDNIIVCSWRANSLLKDGSLAELKLLTHNFERILNSTKPTE